MEKVNYIISTYLHPFVRYNTDHWHELLLFGKFVYNLSIHASTRKSLFELDLEYIPRLPINIVICTALNPNRKSKLGVLAIFFTEQMKLNL
jgi:hypothetical protein